MPRTDQHQTPLPAWLAAIYVDNGTDRPTRRDTISQSLRETATVARDATVQTAQPRPYASKTESRFAERLALDTHLGNVGAWWHHPIQLWLAPGLRYTPDFGVQDPGALPMGLHADMPLRLAPAFVAACPALVEARLVLYETKASWGHDAPQARSSYDRLKVAASLYPAFRFRLARWNRAHHDWTIMPVGDA